VVRRAKDLDDAVEQLRRDPAHPVRARLDELEVELRAVPPARAAGGLGDQMAALGPWEGESQDEILRLLAEGRRSGGSAAPPGL
jgi:hypothetical protein